MDYSFIQAAGCNMIGATAMICRGLMQVFHFQFSGRYFHYFFRQKNPLLFTDNKDFIFYVFFYKTGKMAGVAGFEPTSDGVKVRCLTAWLYPNVKLVIRMKQTWWWGTDSNRRTRRERIYSPPRLATSLPHRIKFAISCIASFAYLFH